jgi:hypothetical protein
VKSSAPDIAQHGGPAKFVLTAKVGKGTYYAGATSATSGLDGNSCSAASSKSIKVS